ncbi:MAG: response regulator [Phycisphaerae bacterium]
MNPVADILLIDDDPLVQDAVKMILEPEGYKVRGCLTVPIGLDSLRADPPDLLLLDIMLATPTEGFHLAYEMRNDPQLKTIPIIVLSAVGRTYGLDFAKDVGSEFLPVEHFVTKPISAAVLRDAVRSVLMSTEAHP